MVSLTDMSSLGEAALLGQETLIGSELDNSTDLGSSTTYSMGSRSAYIPREASSNSASGTTLDTPDLSNQPTSLETTTASNSTSEIETTNKEDNLNSDFLTGMVEGSPLVGSAGASIKDTNYSIPDNAYFVSPTGNDANSGTKNSPWRTLSKALDSAPRNSTIVLREGTYREGDLTLDERLTLQPYPHEEVWIKGSLKVEDWSREGDLWRKDNWNYQFSPNTQPENIDPDHPMAAYRDMVFIDGNSLEQVNSKNKVGAGEFYVDYANNKLYIGTNPADKNVEATAFDRAFTMQSSSASSIVRGLGFARYAETGVFAYTPEDITLENNTFVWNSYIGAILQETSGTVVKGNTFSYNGMSGLAGRQLQGALVEQNTLSYNNIENFNRSGSAAGAKLSASDNLTVRNNTVENNNAHAIWFDVSSTDVTAVRNIVKDNNGHGIFFETSHKAIIASNVSVRNNKGIAVVNSSRAEVWNNTLSNNGDLNLSVTDGSRSNTNQAEIDRGITWKTNNTVIMNNLFSNTQESGFDCFLLNVWTDSYNGELGPMVSKLDFNGYYRSSTSQPPSTLQYKLDKDVDKKVSYASLADFKQGNSGKETNGFEIVQSTNPFFDVANSNHRLKPGSPAIGAGAPLPADIASAVGVQAGVKVNLGAIWA